MEQRYKVRVLVKDFGSDISMPLGELIDHLNDALETAHAQGLSDVKMEFTDGYSDDVAEFEIYGSRLETNEEVARRVDQQRRTREMVLRAQEQQERDTYERLKAKFGDNA